MERERIFKFALFQPRLPHRREEFVRARVSIVAVALVAASCSGVKSVQLRPPMPPPSGLIWGYGVEKIGPDPMHGRQSAYLKAIDDLLTRGPVFVTRTIQDNTY